MEILQIELWGSWKCMGYIYVKSLKKDVQFEIRIYVIILKSRGAFIHEEKVVEYEISHSERLWKAMDFKKEYSVLGK